MTGGRYGYGDPGHAGMSSVHGGVQALRTNGGRWLEGIREAGVSGTFDKCRSAAASTLYQRSSVWYRRTSSKHLGDNSLLGKPPSKKLAVLRTAVSAVSIEKKRPSHASEQHLGILSSRCHSSKSTLTPQWTPRLGIDRGRMCYPAEYIAGIVTLRSK